MSERQRDTTPPPDHGEFERLQRFAFRGIKRLIQALRNKRAAALRAKGEGRC